MVSNNHITRKKFLHIFGSVLAGAGIAGISAILLHRMYAKNDKPTISCNLTEAKWSDCSGCAFDCPRKINK